MKRLVTLSIFGITAVVSTVFSLQEETKPELQQQEKEPPRIVIPADDGNAIERRDFMRTKMMYTQNIFEGLTKGDFKLVNSGIEKVNGITEAEAWVTIEDPIYQKLTEDFEMTTRRLDEAAKSKNIEAIALRFYQMSTSCIDCHKHVREAAYEL